MHQSPRIRRLHNDLAALERLRSESSVFRFTATGDPPQQYHIIFAGKEFVARSRQSQGARAASCRDQAGGVLSAEHARDSLVDPDLSPQYLRDRHGLSGGYGTHWVPSVQLDDLCVMLWDMARYHNYDIRSPYNRESALWVAGQTNVSVSDRCPAAPRPASLARAGWLSRRNTPQPTRPHLDRAESLRSPRRARRPALEHAGCPRPPVHRTLRPGTRRRLRAPAERRSMSPKSWHACIPTRRHAIVSPPIDLPVWPANVGRTEAAHAARSISETIAVRRRARHRGDSWRRDRPRRLRWRSKRLDDPRGEPRRCPARDAARQATTRSCSSTENRDLGRRRPARVGLSRDRHGPRSERIERFEQSATSKRDDG